MLYIRTNPSIVRPWTNVHWRYSNWNTVHRTSQQSIASIMATIWTLSGTGALWINTVGVCAMSLNFMISPKSRRLRKSHSPVFNPRSWLDIPWSSHSRAPGKVWGPPAWSHDAPKTSHTSNGSGDHNRNKGAKRLSWALSLLQNQCPNQHPIIAGSYINVYIYIL